MTTANYHVVDAQLGLLFDLPFQPLPELNQSGAVSDLDAITLEEDRQWFWMSATRSKMLAQHDSPATTTTSTSKGTEVASSGQDGCSSTIDAESSASSLGKYPQRVRAWMILEYCNLGSLQVRPVPTPG